MFGCQFIIIQKKEVMSLKEGKEAETIGAKLDTMIC